MFHHSLLHPADQIVDIMSRIYAGGMTTTSGGNLSVLDSDGCIWISPGGIDKGSLRREDIVCIRPDGSVSGIHKPSSEHPFHRAVYKMRPDVKAVLHAHPPALVAFSVAGIVPDTAILPDAGGRCGKVGFAPYDVPGSDALGRKVGAEFEKGFAAVLLENHGVCIAAPTLLDAFVRFEALDFVARTHAHACRLGKPVTLTESEIAAVLSPPGVWKPLRRTVYTSEEAEKRRTMAELIRRAYRQRLFTCASGVFAARLSDGSFLVTPHGFDRAYAEPGDIVRVQGDACEEGATPSRLARLAATVFDAQPDISSILFAAPPHLGGYAVAHEPFDPRTIPESYIQLREMPTLPFMARAPETGLLAAAISPRHPVILVENAFAVAAGTTLLEPFDRLEVAEYSAMATLTARDIGTMRPISPDRIADIVSAFHLLP